MKINWQFILGLSLWITLVGVLSCTAVNKGSSPSGAIPVQVQADATMDRTATAAFEIIEAALSATAVSPMRGSGMGASVPAPDATKTAAALNVAAAVAATLTAQSVATPTPDLAAPQTMEALQVATMLATTLTAQPTATTDQAATQTEQAHSVETVVAATLTAQPPPTAAPSTNTPSCQPATLFIATWQTYQNKLGCPTSTLQQGAITIEPFAGGYLVWIKATDRLLYTLRNRGGWSTHVDTWEVGMPEFACEEARSYGFPAMGFGMLWCLDAEVKSSLGAPSNREMPDDFAQLQLFEGGRIFHTQVGRTFILFTDYTWVAL